ncbi:MAG: NAD-binding protein [Treponema sp.]|nr:NAD-binding protein [Treponema sp.]
MTSKSKITSGEKGKTKRRLKRIFTNPFTYVGIASVIVIIICTLIVHAAEMDAPETEITNWKDAIWHTIVAVSAAYFDYYTKSVPGRLASLLMLFFGMIIFSFVTGRVTSGFMNMVMKGNKGLKKLRGMKDHLIICGWRPGFDKILDAVMQANPDISAGMIVLVNEAPSEQMEQLRSELQFKEINYVAGDFADAETLKRAFIEKAKRILVISDSSKDRSEMETDSQTVLAVLAMKSLNPNVYVTAEILDKKFEEHLQLAKCDEILMTQEYEHSLLATASSGKGYSNVIKSLIAEDSHTGVVITDIISGYVQKTYKELLDYYYDKTGEVLVGLLLKSENKTVLNPPDDFIITADAKSILICAEKTEA